MKEKVLKAIRMLLCICMVICLLCGCGKGNGGVSAASVKKFMNYISDAAYSDAIELYHEKIEGNAELEQEAAAGVTAYLNDLKNDIFSGKVSDTDANTKVKTVDKVYQGTNCTVEDYHEITAEIQSALQSKVAYQSGEMLMDQKNYADAIGEYGKVLEEDSNYQQAQEKMQQAKDAYKKDVMDKIKTFLDKNEYSEAISRLNDAAKVLPDDSEILATLNTCKKNHVAKFVDDAAAAFTDYTKYEEALKLIQAGLQFYPDNETLLAKKEYYISFEPLNLFDVKPIKGSIFTYDTDKDIYNNTYSKAYYSSGADVYYDLKGKYNQLTATVYPRSTSTQTNYTTLQISGDGKSLYDNMQIAENGKPFDIDLNVTGVQELHIIVDNYAWGGVGIANLIVRKTVK